MTARVNLEALEAALAGRSAGEWKIETADDWTADYPRGVRIRNKQAPPDPPINYCIGWEIAVMSGVSDRVMIDAALIAAAVNALPALIDELRAARAVVEAVASDDCIVWGHGEESSNLTERTCGLCGESHSNNLDFVHAPDCAWVLARAIAGKVD